MRKLIVSALSILMMTGASAFAQDVVKTSKDSTTTSVATTSNTDPVKTEIKFSELPQPVQDALTSVKSQGWEPTQTAFSVKGADGKVIFYTVTVKNATTVETKTFNLDGEGKIVKE